MEFININKDKYDNEIFSLIKKKKFDYFLKFVYDNENIDLDIYDQTYNYVIHYLILFDRNDIIEKLLNKKRLRLDVVDIDGKNILYNIIKFNYIDILNTIIKFDSKTIGVSIIDNIDKSGSTGLHYCCIFNNNEAAKILIDNNADVNINDSRNKNFFQIGLEYKRNNILLYGLKKIKDNVFKIKYKDGNTLLQESIEYKNNEIINYFLSLEISKKYIDNQNIEFGLSALHQSIILKNNNLSKKLIDMGADFNLIDNLGNTIIHYCIIEENFDFLENLINDYIRDVNKINLNIPNLNGNTPLHLFLFKMGNKDDISIYKNILLKIIENTNINIQNNNNISSFNLLLKYNFWKDDNIKSILKNGNNPINLFLKDSNNENLYDKVKDNQEIIDIVVDSYYNNLLKVKENKEVDIPWEKYCASRDLDNLVKILNKKKLKNLEYYCKEEIRNVIEKKERSIPIHKKINLSIDSGIYKDGCFYTGSTIDILFGLLYLFENNLSIDLILQYPLTQNDDLLNYYNKIGISNNLKKEFMNIEIIWTFQKLIYPLYFENLLLNSINTDNKFIVIPIGIELEQGSHANILIIDKSKLLIERFEPNGRNHPNGLYYNPKLLDSLLSLKFKDILPNYKYVSPINYLPVIGFQMLETLQDKKCKKISDPNGFCAIWCVWWAEKKITNNKYSSELLALNLIEQIKIENKSFKKIIRNYSQKITSLRDNILIKYDLDIHKWVNDDFENEIINKIESDILEMIR